MREMGKRSLYGSVTVRPRASCGRGCTPNTHALVCGRCCFTRWIRAMANSARGDLGKSSPSRCPPRQATTLPASSHSGGRPTRPSTKTTTCSTPTGASLSRLRSDRPGLASRPAGRPRSTPTIWPPSTRRRSSPTAHRHVWGWSPQRPVRRRWRSWAGTDPATTTTTPRSSPPSSVTGNKRGAARRRSRALRPAA